MTGVNLSLSFIAAQAAALRTSLQLQPNAGTEVQRARWMLSLAQAETLAATKVGRFASYFLGEDWNLKRAKGLIDRVGAQALAAGTLLADPSDGFNSNVSRFASSPRARVYQLRSGTVREERPSDLSVRLVETLFSSDHPPFQTLVSLLDRAFEAHIRKLDALVSLLPDLVIGEDIPSDAAYPRLFHNAHGPLMDYLRRALVAMNDGKEVPWERCRREAIEILMERQARREGINPKTSVDSELRHRDASIARQIPEYSGFQLFCLLRQIRDGYPDTALIEELRRAPNGRVVELEDVYSAGIGWKDLLKASELIGNIDVIHANIDVAMQLARREQPLVRAEIVDQQVMAAVARLGKETGSSRAEYDGAIAELKRLESNPSVGKVIPFRTRRSK